MIRSDSSPWIAALVVAVVSVAACQKEGTALVPAPPQVESRALGLVITALPERFRLEVNQGTTLRFASDGASGAGQLSISVDSTQRAVIILEEARAAQKELEARPEAAFAGGNELVTPAGTGYAVRGSWVENGARVEERRVFALHPDGSGRLVTLVDRYPAGDAANASDRFGRELALLSALEAAAAETPR